MIYYLLSSRCQREVHHESYQHSRLRDNYIWLLDDRQGRCIIVDPGEAQPVLEALQRLQLTPAAILLTHHHHDHVGGVAQIVAQYPGFGCLWAAETADKGASHIVRDGDTFAIDGRQYKTIAVPGHTLGHVAFYSALICSAATQFSPPAAAGCLKAAPNKCTTHFNNSRNFPITP